MDKPFGLKARLAVVIGSVGRIFAFAAVAVLTLQYNPHLIGQSQVERNFPLLSLQPINAGRIFRDVPILQPDVVRVTLCACQSRSRTGITLKGIKMTAADIAEGKMGKV